MTENIFDRIHRQAVNARPAQSLARAPLSAKAAAAGKRVARTPALQPEVASATNRLQPVGAIDPASGREITQPSDNPAVNQALATQAMAEFRHGLEQALKGLAGARLEAVREVKNPLRLAEKVAVEGQPAETVPDYGAAQIAVDSRRTRDAVAAAVKRRFRVLREIDRFDLGDPVYGYRALSLQVQMPNGSSEELQIAPREVLEANRLEHRDYRKAREAELAGKDAGARQARARAINDAAMRRFEQRNEDAGERAAGLAKGCRVKLSDGAEATVCWLHPGLKLARVQTADGRNLTVRVKDLQPDIASAPPAGKKIAAPPAS